MILFVRLSFTEVSMRILLRCHLSSRINTSFQLKSQRTEFPSVWEAPFRIGVTCLLQPKPSQLRLTTTFAAVHGMGERLELTSWFRHLPSRMTRRNLFHLPESVSSSVESMMLGRWASCKDEALLHLFHRDGAPRWLEQQSRQPPIACPFSTPDLPACSSGERTLCHVSAITPSLHAPLARSLHLCWLVSLHCELFKSRSQILN